MPGVNSFRVTVHTGPQPCTWGYSPKSFRGCPDPRAWFLPAGRYSTKVILTGLPPETKMPKSVTVVVYPVGFKAAG